MYKCLDCGHIFEDGEQVVGKQYHDEIPGGFYEEFSECPVCGGEYEETHSCEKCGGEFLYDELCGGYYCKECVREAVNFESFLDFAASGVKEPTEVDSLDDFVLRKLLGVESPREILMCSSSTLKSHMRNLYNEAVKADLLHQHFGGDGELLDKILAYLSSCDLWDDFAEYMHAKEVKA